ncbi:MAG: HD-GYP domain-containing protein [Treponema sp.]
MHICIPPIEQYHDLIAAIVTALEERDIYTQCHSMRVADMSQKIASLLNLSESETELIHIAAHLHDIGKIGIDDAILRKAGKLNDDEWEIIKSHTTIGYKILHKIEAFADVSKIVLHHHERWDGKGYPEGISGTRIPFGSRIIAVADSIDAMMSSRVYRSGLPSEKCYLEIQKNIGKMYDPQIAPVVLENWKTIVEIRNDFSSSNSSDIENINSNCFIRHE